MRYTYNGNQLTAVNDNLKTATQPDNIDFHDGNSTGSNEYAYDFNGNLVRDDNRGITLITYNHLNQPSEIYFGSTRKIVYLYSALGQKLVKQIVVNNTVTQRTDYINGMEVTPSTLSTVVQTGGGRFVKLTGGSWEPQYCYTDHRGDIRVVYRANSTTGTAEMVQEDHLTPFGVQMVGMGRTNWPENQYRYQGKELNTTGFDTNGDNTIDSRLYQYDFGARQYDPLIGRWHSADPMMQYVSPYMAMGNDWVNRVDPTGMEDNMAKYIRAYYQEINQFLLTARRNRAEEIDQIYGRGVYVGNPAFYWRNTLYKMAGGSGGESTFQVATFSNGASIVTGRGGEIDHHNASARSDGRTGAYVQIRGEIIYTPYSDEAPFMNTDVICRWTDFPGVDTYHSDNPEDYRRPEMVKANEGRKASLGWVFGISLTVTGAIGGGGTAAVGVIIDNSFNFRVITSTGYGSGGFGGADVGVIVAASKGLTADTYGGRAEEYSASYGFWGLEVFHGISAGAIDDHIQGPYGVRVAIGAGWGATMMTTNTTIHRFQYYWLYHIIIR